MRPTPSARRADYASFISCEPLESRRLLAAVKIMPLGDSITESFTDNAGYRFWLWKQLKLDGYDIDFVGSVNKAFDFSAGRSNFGPTLYQDFDQDHEGHSAFRADQLLAELPTYLAQNVPDVVLLQIGLNDMLQSRSVEETIGHIGSIIDSLRGANASVTVLLATIAPTRVLNQNMVALNAAMPALVSAKSTEQSRVVLVDQAAGYSADADLRDEFHPNLQGELKWSGKFYSALKPILPAPATPPAPVTWITDLRAAGATNGLGPVEVNLSNGGAARNDGGAINLNGVSTIKGLGVHANSEVVYTIPAGRYARFQAEVGIDDTAGAGGSVVFQVFVNDTLRFDSGVMTGTAASKAVDVPLNGATSLRLVVTDAGDGTELDHADWANARLIPAARPTPPPPTPTPTPTPTPEPAPTPVTLTRAQFDFTRAPHELRLTFSADVSASLARSDLRVKNLSIGRYVSTSAMRLSYDRSTNTATFTFPGLGRGGILPDGNYRGMLAAAGITDAAGNNLAADFTFNFFFLAGDANRDAKVDRADFDILVANYRGTGRTFAQGDLNYDGTVSYADFGILAGNYGTSLVNGSLERTTGGKRLAKLIKELREDLKDRDKELKEARKKAEKEARDQRRREEEARRERDRHDDDDDDDDRDDDRRDDDDDDDRDDDDDDD